MDNNNNNNNNNKMKFYIFQSTYKSVHCLAFQWKRESKVVEYLNWDEFFFFFDFSLSQSFIAKAYNTQPIFWKISCWSLFA